MLILLSCGLLCLTDAQAYPPPQSYPGYAAGPTEHK